MLLYLFVLFIQCNFYNRFQVPVKISQGCTVELYPSKLLAEAKRHLGAWLGGAHR